MNYIIIIAFLFGVMKENHSSIAKKVACNFEKNFAAKMGLSMFSYGGGMMKGIERYCLGFTSYKKVDVSEARRMFVNLTEKFLMYVNESEASPYFIKHPYDETDLSLNIHYNSAPNQHVQENYIASVSMYNGNMFYSVYKSERLNEVHREKYSEAYEIVTGKPFKDRKIISMDSQQ